MRPNKAARRGARRPFTAGLARLPWPSLLLCALLASCFAACAGSESFEAPAAPAAEAEHVQDTSAMPSLPGMSKKDTASATPDGVVAEPGTDAPPQNRDSRLIYRAELRLASAEPDAAARALISWGKEHGGYVLSQDGNSLVLRIPSAHFYSSIDHAAQGAELLDRRINVEDVSEQYFDLQTRIENAADLRVRLSALLERAAKVEDALEIERELARVTGELEVLKGKLRRLQELVAYSTISATWVELAVDELQGSSRLPFPWLATLGLGSLLQMEDQS